MKTETIKTKLLRRTFVVDRAKIDEEKRTVPLSFSSETPVDRWFGTEILGHADGEVDLSFLGSGRAPFLVGHWTENLAGVVESAEIGSDRKGRAVVRFGKSDFAEEIFADVKDGVRPNISVGYYIKKMRLEEDDEEKGRTYRAISWKPVEISSVPIPADENVGVLRKAEDRPRPDIETIIEYPDEYREKRNKTMETETKAETKNETPAPVIDVKAIENETRAKEKARVRDILAIGEQHDVRDIALTAVKDGTSLADFREMALALLESRGTVERVKQGADIGLNDRETRQFSFIRAINALANPTDRKAQERAAFEFDCSKAVSDKLGRTASGIMVPMEVLARDMVVGTDASGGYLVATDLLAANFIEILRNKMMTRALGAITLSGLVGDVAIPKQTGGATAYWVAEGGDVTESTPVLAQLALTPKTCGAWTDLSRKLLKQSAIGAEAFVRGDLAACLALALDAAGIAGTGSNNQPTGILNTTGIGDVAGGTDGAAPDWADVVALETEVAIDNADVGALAYLTNAKVRGKLKQTEKAATTGQFVWENGVEPGFGLLNGYRAAVSNQVPSDLDKGGASGVCSALIFGNFADLVYGLWGTVDITVDPYTNATSGTVRVVALQDADVGVRHAESFAAMQDALTA